MEKRSIRRLVKCMLSKWSCFEAVDLRCRRNRSRWRWRLDWTLRSRRPSRRLAEGRTTNRRRSFGHSGHPSTGHCPRRTSKTSFHSDWRMRRKCFHWRDHSVAGDNRQLRSSKWTTDRKSCTNCVSSSGWMQWSSWNRLSAGEDGRFPSRNYPPDCQILLRIRPTIFSGKSWIRLHSSEPSSLEQSNLRRHKKIADAESFRLILVIFLFVGRLHFNYYQRQSQMCRDRTSMHLKVDIFAVVQRIYSC